MNDRLRRLLIIFGPIIGAILLFYVVNAAIGTYSVGVEELRHERHAEATAEAAHAMTETTELTDSGATTDVNPVDVTEAITSILPTTVTEAINLDTALTETVPMSDTATMTDTEAASEEAATEEVTATEEISATETVTE